MPYSFDVFSCLYWLSEICEHSCTQASRLQRLFQTLTEKTNQKWRFKEKVCTSLSTFTNRMFTVSRTTVNYSKTTDLSTQSACKLPCLGIPQVRVKTRSCEWFHLGGKTKPPIKNRQSAITLAVDVTPILHKMLNNYIELLASTLIFGVCL